MYSVIIADDEKKALRDIEMILVNNGFSFEKIYKVQSGAEVKKIIEKDDGVRLILSDINMPEFDGLQLLDYVKKYNKDIFVIFVTGYAKFEYAKYAIDNGASGFILKPINESELCNCIEKVNTIIKKEAYSDEKYNIKLIGSIIRMLLETGKCTEGEKEYINEKCNIGENSELYLIMIKNFSEDEKIFDDISCCIKNNNSSRGKFFLFKGYEKNEMFCLCVMDKQGDSIRNEIFDIYERLGEKKDKTYLSVSGVSDRILPIMYQQCKDAYYEKISDPLENIFFYSARREYSLETILVQARLLEKAMDIDDSDGAVACIEKMFEIYSDSKDKLYFRDVYKIAVNTIELYRTNISEEIIPEGEKVQKDYIIESSSDISEVVDALSEYLKINCIKKDEGSIDIQAVVEYVNCNYMNELTLEETGKLFNIVPNYLSRKFKKTTGESFVQCVNRKRIEKAIELLTQTDIKVVVIADMVGFKDHQYFHKIFKKNVGETPIEYRMRIRAQK